MTKERIRGKKREAVAERAGGRCEYCRCPEYIGTQGFSVEHVVPRDKGGTNDADNLALSCQGCNNHKHTSTEAPDPAMQDLAPLFHPRQQRWDAHFCWSDDFTLVVGLTPTGRATVERLQLNRAEVVRFRRVLYAAGEHPPVEQYKSS